MFVDPLGLSPKDVEKIIEKINRNVVAMTNNGERLPDPTFNNICKSYPLLSPSTALDCGKNPEKLKDCEGQITAVFAKLNNLKFGFLDDHWACLINGGL